MTFKSLFILVILFWTSLSFSESVDHDVFVDVRLHRTQCDARWEFSKYMDCLERTGLIPGVKAAYLTSCGIKRFYDTSIGEGVQHCRSIDELPENLFQACVNRFVAHKAQMIGVASSAHTEFSNVESVGSGSIN